MTTRTRTRSNHPKDPEAGEQPALLRARGRGRAPVKEPGATPTAVDEPGPDPEGPVDEDARTPRPGQGPDAD